MAIRTRERKILRDIFARKRRTFLISTGIFIGVMGTIALFSLGDILIKQIQRDINNQDIAMLNTLVVATAPEPANDAYIAYLKSIIGVTQAQGSVRAPVRWHKPHTDDTHTATVNGYDLPFDDITIEPPRLIEGDYPRTGEIAVDMRFADRYGLDVGDDLIVDLPNSDTNAAYKISGIVFHAYNLAPEEAIYTSLADANRMSGTTGYNLISMRFVDFDTAYSTADHVSAVLLHDTDYLPIQYQLQDPTYNPLNEGARRISATINLLAVLALLMSGFSVVNIINKIVREQKTQIGLLKAMGATRLDLITIYIGIAFIYGLLGVIPGVIVGMPLGYFLADYLAPELNTTITGFAFSLRAIAIGVALGLVVPVAAALWPVWQGTRITILQAMNDRGIDEHYQDGLIAACIQHLPMPIGGRLSLHNLNKKKMRLSLTIAALTVAVGAYMGILAVFNTLDDHVDSVLVSLDENLVTAPVLPDNISMTAVQARPRAEVFDDVHNTTVQTRPFDPATNSSMYLTMGEHIVDRNDVIISNVYSEETNLSVGDTIRLQVQDTRADFDIVGIAPFPIAQIWVHKALAPTPTIPAPALDNDEIHPNTFNEAPAFDFLALIKGFSLDLGMYQALLSAISLLIGLVGGLGLLTTLSLSVIERQREIGVMRSIGAGSLTIIMQFILEGLVVGFIAWLIGIPVSGLIADQLIKSMGLTDLFEPELRLDAALTGLVAVMVIAAVASIWPAYIAATRTVSSILRYN